MQNWYKEAGTKAQAATLGDMAAAYEAQQAQQAEHSKPKGRDAAYDKRKDSGESLVNLEYTDEQLAKFYPEKPLDSFSHAAEVNGWLSPAGKYYDCMRKGHTLFLLYILGLNGKPYPANIYAEGHKAGWLRVYGDEWGNLEAEGRRPWFVKQLPFLKKIERSVHSKLEFHSAGATSWYKLAQSEQAPEGYPDDDELDRQKDEFLVQNQGKDYIDQRYPGKPLSALLHITDVVGWLRSTGEFFSCQDYAHETFIRHKLGLLHKDYYGSGKAFAEAYCLGWVRLRYYYPNSGDAGLIEASGTRGGLGKLHYVLRQLEEQVDTPVEYNFY